MPGSTKLRKSSGHSLSSKSSHGPRVASGLDGIPPRWSNGPVAERAARRNRALQQKYGITLDQFEKMLLIQRGKCGICERFFYGTRRMFVDHDHKAPHRVRGILCYVCNKRVLGRGLEDPGLHERAAVYLRSTFDGRNLGKAGINDQAYQ